MGPPLLETVQTGTTNMGQSTYNLSLKEATSRGGDSATSVPPPLSLLGDLDGGIGDAL